MLVTIGKRHRCKSDPKHRRDPSRTGERNARFSAVYIPLAVAAFTGVSRLPKDHVMSLASAVVALVNSAIYFPWRLAPHIDRPRGFKLQLGSVVVLF